MAQPLKWRGGRGVRALPLRKKNFFWSSRKQIPPKNVTTKLEGGGGKALVAGPLMVRMLHLSFTALHATVYASLPRLHGINWKDAVPIALCAVSA